MVFAKLFLDIGVSDVRVLDTYTDGSKPNQLPDHCQITRHDLYSWHVFILKL